MKSKASATWQGGLKGGGGTVSAANGAFGDVGLTFAKRFEGAEGPGTTPEELIAAAHAGCFSMAFSASLEKAGFIATSVATEATVTLEPRDGKPTVVSSHLVTRAKVPNITQAQFDEVAQGAKAGCPISRLLNTEITLDATLES